MTTYALLSPTFGMRQYTAHLAARARRELGQEVRVVTTSAAPLDRYSSDVEIITPVNCRTTGFARDGMDVAGYRAALAALLDAAGGGPVHFTGVHLWNVALVRQLLARGIPVVHTLHDLAPHSDVRRGALIRLWNRLLITSGATILVHGECYRRELLDRGVSVDRVRFAPLTHGFWTPNAELAQPSGFSPANPVKSDNPLVLFFGRVERYKGADTLIEAWRLAQERGLTRGTLVVAGRVAPGVTLPPLPPAAELRDRRVDDAEARDLFAQAALLVLPYRDATQSALIAAAAAFGVPSLVTATGALPEYVAHGNTGWVVPPGDPSALADALIAALSDQARLLRVGQAAQERRLAMLESELQALAALYAVAPSPAIRAQSASAPDASGEYVHVQR